MVATCKLFRDASSRVPFFLSREGWFWTRGCLLFPKFFLKSFLPNLRRGPLFRRRSYRAWLKPVSTLLCSMPPFFPNPSSLFKIRVTTTLKATVTTEPATLPLPPSAARCQTVLVPFVCEPRPKPRLQSKSWSASC